MKQKLFSFILPLACVAGLHAQQAADRIPGRLLVGIRADANEEEVGRALKSHRAEDEGAIEAIRVREIRVPEQAADNVRRALENTKLFTFVEPDGVAEGQNLPNDPKYASQWHLSKISAPNAWLSTTGSTGVVIAVVDSGIDSTHPDLASKVLPGWSYLTNTAVTADVLGHGTKVAGAAAALSNNAVGVAGVSWQSPVLPVVVLNSSNSASYSNISKGIIYAADRGARVINVSIGGTMASSTLQNAVNYAWNKGAVVIAAAGNAGTSAKLYPAACDNVVAVGATTSTDAKASYSNYGPWVDLVAPGTGIYTTVKGGTYGSASGTSFASPVTAGVAALILSLRPSLTPSGLVSILTASVDDLGMAGVDSTFGAGRVNAYKAAANAAAFSFDTAAPVVTLSSPAAGTTVSNIVYVQGQATDTTAVSRVELYVDGALTSTTASGSFSFIVDTARLTNDKSHTFTVRAYDTSQNAAQVSTTVQVRN